jgi:hypothetical protein
MVKDQERAERRKKKCVFKKERDQVTVKHSVILATLEAEIRIEVQSHARQTV